MCRATPCHATPRRAARHPCPLQHCTRSPTSCSPPRRSPCSASTASGTCRGEQPRPRARPAPHPVPCPDHRARRESRAHCIDIETAYMQGCQRLDQAVMVSRASTSQGGGNRGAVLPAAPQPPRCPRAGREGAADLHARGHRPPQGHDRGGAQQCQRGGGGHQLPLRPHAGAGQLPTRGALRPRVPNARARQSRGSGRGLGQLRGTGRPCRLQEQLSERKKALLKAVQR